MTTTYIDLVSGVQTQKRTVTTSAGAGDVDKIPNLNASGVLGLTITNGTVTSAGAGDTGKLAALDASGKLDLTVMPAGVGANTAVLTTTEAIAAGDYVNVNATGVRKADASNGRRAHGFALAGAASAASLTVYFGGSNTQVTGRTLGDLQYLSATTPGLGTPTPPAVAGQIVQELGVAVSTTSVNFAVRAPVTLA